MRYVAEMSPGISDEEVLGLSREGEELLLTNDKDFGELVFRRGQAAHGVMLLRLAGVSSAEKGRLVARAVRDHARELEMRFSVVERDRIRIRSKPVE